MAIPGSANLLLAGSAQAYQLEQSLRFDPADDTTLTVHTGWSSQRTWTWSCWVKFANPSSEQYIWLSRGTNCGLAVSSTGELRTTFNDSTIGSGVYLRDPSAWYHIVVKAEDYSSSSPGYSDIYVYLNNKLVQTRAAQTRGFFTFSTQTAYIGRYGNYTPAVGELDGYLAEVHMTDGYAYNPTDFGEYDNNGVWRPIEVTGLNYGSNGFYHTFDPSATNGLGHDHSGNGNNSTPYGFSTGSVDYAATGADPSSKIQSGSYQDFWDGNTSTGIVIGQGAYVQMTTGSLPAATSTVGFYTGNGASTAYLRINGTEEFSATSTTVQWWDFSFSGAINKVEIGYLGGSGSSNTYRAFRIDGTTIVGNPGKDLDVLSDTPTTNWCTLNPLSTYNNNISNGNLSYSQTNSSNAVSQGTIGMQSGKWYWEIDATNIGNGVYGITRYEYPTQAVYGCSNGYGTGFSPALNTAYINSSTGSTSYCSSPSAPSSGTYMFAFDADARKFWMGVNGTWYTKTGGSAGNPGAGTNELFGTSDITAGVVYRALIGGSSVTTVSGAINFGQRDFAYTPPTGFKALNTKNLPAPDIADGSQHMNTVLWTGTGASRTIDFGMQPDWIWAKGRNTGANHRISDNVRGGDGTTFYNLCTNNTNVENTDTVINGITSTGVTFKNVNDHPNISGSTYVGWGWKANGSGSTNTAGDIQSTVSANPSAGFSIVSWTSDAASSVRSMGHGLGNEPTFIVVKNRDVSDNWYVWHQDLPAKTYALYFTDGQQQSFGSTTIWSTSSTTFGIRQSSIATGTQDCIAYCFTEVEGYSKFGSYTGNGSTNGPFVYTGFKPAFVMIKVTDQVTTHWMMRDDKRDTDNPNSAYLLPSSSLQEYTNLDFDFLSNGFKLRHTNGVENVSGKKYVFAAFASSPFGGSGVSPATAR